MKIFISLNNSNGEKYGASSIQFCLKNFKNYDRKNLEQKTFSMHQKFLNNFIVCFSAYEDFLCFQAFNK